MPKTDKLKEEIGWLKVVFGILMATDISLVAWLVQNYSSANILLLVFCGIAVILVTGAIVRVNKTAYRKIDELGEL